MSTFGITDTGQMMDALNYALSNLGQSTTLTGNSVSINTTTGEISQGTNLLSYYYKYLYIAYANTADGSSGFSTTVRTNKLYFGVLNNNSTSPGTINNPSSYQWTEVAGGGFGTTYALYYTTIGGRQIGFIVDTALPGSGYVQAPTSPTGIDLDFVTQVAALPIVVMTAYQRANSLPATPTGGTYDFGNLIFTAPATWSNSIPSGNAGFYSSQNTFKATTTGNITVGPSGPWTTAVLTGQVGANGVSTYTYPIYQSANATPATPTGGYWNFGTTVGTPPAGWSNVAASGTGNIIYSSLATISTSTPNANVSVGNTWSSPAVYSGEGQQGERGFIPMAYVLTPQTPVGNLANVAFQASLSSWFAAGTGGTVAPVGTGYPAVGGDTAAFTYEVNTSVVSVYTFNSGNLLWSPANGQVINGNVFVTGSVNASKLNANEVYTLILKGGNAVLDSNTSGGFWANAKSGNARFGGSMSIGNLLTVGSNATIGGNLTVGNNANIANNLTIGNNTYIGGNLTVAGLITGNGAISVLNANTVTTTTVVPGSVTFTDYFQSYDSQFNIANAAIDTLYYSGTVIANNVSTSGNILSSTGIFNDWDSCQSILYNADLYKLSGSGTFAANTWALDVIDQNSFYMNNVPTTPLSGAVIKALGVMDYYNRGVPGIYMSTSAANQIVQLNFNASFEVDATLTALASNLQGQLQVTYLVGRFPYVGNGQVPPTAEIQFIYGQDLGLPACYISQPGGTNYVLGLPISLAGIIDTLPTAGLYVYTIAAQIAVINGTWRIDRFKMSAMAGNGTVLKNQ